MSVMVVALVEPFAVGVQLKVVIAYCQLTR